jgi:hypothetical protein
MMERAQWTLYLAWIACIEGIIIAALVAYCIHLVRQIPGSTPEIVQSIEGMRAQNSAEHGSILGPVRESNSKLKALLERFGFLK